MKAILAAVVVSSVFSIYTVFEVVDTISQIKTSSIEETVDVIYGHRIGPAGQEMILTSR